MKKWLVCIVVLVVTGGAIALALHNANISKDKVYSWRYKMTDEPVTKKILKTLTWIPHFYDRGRLDGNRYGDGDAKNRLANKLSSGSFTTIREY